MPRTTITAARQLYSGCESCPPRGGLLGELMCEAVEAKLPGRRPRPRSIGIGASGHSDTSERASNEQLVPRS
jgi:hypothetical protein